MSTNRTLRSLRLNFESIFVEITKINKIIMELNRFDDVVSVMRYIIMSCLAGNLLRTSLKACELQGYLKDINM